MVHLISIVVVIFATAIIEFSRCAIEVDYAIPFPKITAFFPAGLKVQIPDAADMKLFTFRANINKPLGHFKQDQLSNEISAKNAEGLWVYEHTYVKLQIDDVLHFSVYVIKGFKLYRFEKRKFKILDLIPSNETISRRRSDWRLCEDEVANGTETIAELQKRIQHLEDENEILRRDQLNGHVLASNLLTLGGISPFTPSTSPHPNFASETIEEQVKNELFIAQNFVHHQLQLAINVVRVVGHNTNGIIFEVATLDEKIAVIKAAKGKLRYTAIFLRY